VLASESGGSTDVEAAAESLDTVVVLSSVLSASVSGDLGLLGPLAALKKSRGRSAIDNPILAISARKADVTAEIGSVGWSSVLYSLARYLRSDVN
jgi:hypothetical protein